MHLIPKLATEENEYNQSIPNESTLSHSIPQRREGTHLIIDSPAQQMTAPGDDFPQQDREKPKSYS